MASSNGAQERVQIDRGLLTAAGIVALFGTLVLGVAALIGDNAVFSAFRQWSAQPEVPPSESVKSVVKQMHHAALAGTVAGTEAWRSGFTSTSGD